MCKFDILLHNHQQLFSTVNNGRNSEKVIKTAKNTNKMVIYRDFEEALPDLDAWLKSQPHLPIIENTLKKKFLKVCDMDMDKTRKLIEINYTIRNSYPNIFLERDPSDSTSQMLLGVLDFVVLENFDSKRNRIVICRLGDPDPDKFFHTEMVKLFLMFEDAHLANMDVSELGDGEIIIFDMKGFTLKHLAKYNFTTLKAFLKFTTDAMAARIMAAHMINCPSYIDKIIAVIRPFLSSELFKLCHFHQPNTETLFEFIDKSILPKEYGGTCGTMEELKKREIEILMKKRDYLVDMKYWKIDDSKRSRRHSKPDAMEGHFRSLAID